jgi:hypothetical protein
LSRKVRQIVPSWLGRSQPSSVIPSARSSDCASATLTQSPEPSSETAEPKRPAGDQPAPLRVPLLP